VVIKRSLRKPISLSNKHFWGKTLDKVLCSFLWVLYAVSQNPLFLEGSRTPAHSNPVYFIHLMWKSGIVIVMVHWASVKKQISLKAYLTFILGRLISFTIIGFEHSCLFSKHKLKQICNDRLRETELFIVSNRSLLYVLSRSRDGPWPDPNILLTRSK